MFTLSNGIEGAKLCAGRRKLTIQQASGPHMSETTTPTTTPPVYLSGVNYELGEIRDIATLEYFKSDPAQLDKYYKMGMKSYSFCAKPTIELAYYSIAKTLKDAAVDPLTVDTLLFVSEHRGQDRKFGSNEVNELIRLLGMHNAYGIGMSLSDCANILMGIQMARALIASGQSKNVMVVCAHKYGDKPDDRLMEMDVSVCSDGAVSALVTDTPGDYLILGLEHGKYPASDRNGPPLEKSMKKIKTLRSLTKALLEQTHLKTSDIGTIHINNYFELSMIFIESCGFDPSRGFYGNLARNGHVLAGDTLINLKDEENQYKKDQKILLLADGPFASFAACLQRI